MRVLHITSWYPSKEYPERAKFIKEHIEALNRYCENRLIHISIESGRTFVKIQKERIGSNAELYLVKSSLKAWFLKEILVLILLIRIIKELEVNKNYDLINFHIAYPLLAYYKVLKSFISLPIVITEHWTAYQLNFNLPTDTKKLNRIKKIFSYGLPLLAVSKSLIEDIEKFSGIKQENYEVVANVVDTNIFHYTQTPLDKHPSFFALNNWRRIKDPLTLLRAFKRLVRKYYPQAILTVGGYGEMWEAMIEYVEENQLKENINFIGKLTPEEIASEMYGKTAFVHSSLIETFSVVVAEALCCGTPVVVTKLACIEEYFPADCGVLVEGNSEEKWVDAFVQLVESKKEINREELAKDFGGRFSKEVVGKKYFNYLRKVRNGTSE